MLNFMTVFAMYCLNIKVGCVSASVRPSFCLFFAPAPQTDGQYGTSLSSPYLSVWIKRVQVKDTQNGMCPRFGCENL